MWWATACQRSMVLQCIGKAWNESVSELGNFGAGRYCLPDLPGAKRLESGLRALRTRVASEQHYTEEEMLRSARTRRRAMPKQESPTTQDS